MDLEVDTGGLADTADLTAPVDLVDVGLEDVVLFEGGFEADGDGDFEKFAVDLARGVATFLTALEFENIGDELLGDGGGAFADVSGASIADCGAGARP